MAMEFDFRFSIDDLFAKRDQAVTAPIWWRIRVVEELASPSNKVALAPSARGQMCPLQCLFGNRNYVIGQRFFCFYAEKTPEVPDRDAVEGLYSLGTFFQKFCVLLNTFLAQRILACFRVFVVFEEAINIMVRVQDELHDGDRKSTRLNSSHAPT